jgi:transposase
MNVVHPRCAGLDLAKDSLVAAVRLQDGPAVERETRSFGATTRELLNLLEWLMLHEVTHVVMEATGSYWKAVWYVLEGSFEMILANAAHVKAVPGRKSDVNDAQWLSDLLAHGLVRGSFVPPPHVQELRDLTRTRKQLTREIVQHTQRIQKTLDTANIKVVGVISDILGVSGRAILKALIRGESDPDRLADLAHGSLRNKRPQLIEALHGHMQPHHQRLLKLHLNIIEMLEKEVARLERDLGAALRPFRDIVDRVKTIPGVADLTAQTILAEVGFDMSRFPSARHLVSWACLCPRLEMSAGKHFSTRTRKGGNWLKTVLVQAAWAAVRKRDESYLRAQFFRLRARRGPKKAIMAVASSMLTAAFHIIRDGATWHDLGGDYLDRLDRTRQANRLVQRLSRLGFDVTLHEVAA